ncbi:MAG TPA: DNA primase [Acholeplasmataceae bacterium]|nr:DNA primase [Acholeplasmataceae bacterium]
MLIPEATIQKIREEADLVQIIGEFVKLEKKGNNYLGLCPFHQDNNPSLTVSPTKKIYTCFSCGAKGNVFTFLQNFNNISFVEAVKYVGEKSGIAVNIATYYSKTQYYEKYYKILETATKFYEFFLKNSAEGKKALDYLHKRNLNDEIIKRFRIGLAPKENDLLYKSLLQEKHQPLDMIEAGVVRSYRDSYFDIFKNRIVFPLEDIDGHIVGFSGRLYTKIANEPKYVNTSENKIFKKGKLLYNFFRNINEIRLQDEIYVFEGFLDVIAAYRVGINNAVAIMGTALTEDQIQAISKATKNIIICYDGDTAGIEATKRAIRLLTGSGFNVRAVLMPEDLDPDDYLNRYGANKLKELLENSESGIEYLYKVAKIKLNYEDLVSVEAFKTEIFQYLKAFNSFVLTEKFLQKLSEDLQVSVDSLKADFGRIDYRPLPKTKTPRRLIKWESSETKFLKSEKELVRRSYQDKKFCLELYKDLDSHYVEFKNFCLLGKIYDYYQINDIINHDEFLKNLKEEEKKLLEDIINSKEAIYQDLPTAVLIKTVKQYEIIKKYEIEKEAIKENLNGENLKKFAELRKETLFHKE